ncbi:MAG: ABC transporter ATP-binding protein [Coriobacteriia bacterium]|nr:ABC transporter ATP-binding protein [Coriobacteriia bacterium]
MLKTHAITKKYGEFFALKDVSLAVRQGDIYGLVGRNGAGKTTLLKCIMGLARPSSGEVEINGQTQNLRAARHHMGFMINPAFFSYLNPKESLEYLCQVKGIKAKGEVGRLLMLVGLDGVKKPFKEFSLGMKQRLGIAGALLGSPAMVVLDEPINGLDPQGIIDMREVITGIHAQTGTTFVISSHILSELDLIATRFGFIEEGVFVQEITHHDLHEHTRKSLLIEVDDAVKAWAALQVLGIQQPQEPQEPGFSSSREPVIQESQAPAAGKGKGKASQLKLTTHLDQSHLIARTLIDSGVELYDLHRQETTLEEYFVRLIGGDPSC